MKTESKMMRSGQGTPKSTSKPPEVRAEASNWSPSQSQEESILPTPWSWPSSFQNCEVPVVSGSLLQQPWQTNMLAYLIKLFIFTILFIPRALTSASCVSVPRWALWMQREWGHRVHLLDCVVSRSSTSQMWLLSPWFARESKIYTQYQRVYRRTWNISLMHFILMCWNYNILNICVK